MNWFSFRSAVALVLLGFGSALLSGAPPNPFLALDTIARGGPDRVPAMLQELGYDGLGGKALDAVMPLALKSQGLRFFNGYHVCSIDPAKGSVADGKLKRWFQAMHGMDTSLWLAIKTVARNDGTAFEQSTDAADGLVIQELLALARAAAPHGVRIALYPHSGYWLERVDDALRLANAIGRDDVGITFNLCHWLRVEGAERDAIPLLRAALPRLMFVTVSGADTGDTRTFGWDRLIQPLDAGTYDVKTFVRRLRGLPYARPVGFQGYGIKADERTVLRRSIGAWHEFITAPPL